MPHSLMHHSIVLLGFTAFHCHQPRHHPGNTRLRVELTRRRVYNTSRCVRPLLLCVAAPLLPRCCFRPFSVVPFTLAATTGTWSSRTDEWICPTCHPPPFFVLPSIGAIISWGFFFSCIFIFIVFCSSFCILLLVWFVGCCLSALRRFDLIVETFVTKFELVLLFHAVLTSDYDSAYSASASFRWLLLVPSGGSNMFVLICALFTSVTVLCGPLRKPCHLFNQFPICFNYFRTILVYTVSIVWKFTPFSFLGLPTHSSFRIRSEKNQSL
jgi:hypothetical protein